MADDPFAMPRGNPVALDIEGKFALWWHKYIGGIERLSKRQSANVTLNTTDGEIGGLTIGATYNQAEVQALRDKCEELADDVIALRAALIAANLMKL